MEKNNSSKKYLIASILGILILLFISQNFQEKGVGVIEKITYSNNKISITLENKNMQLIIFENKILPIKKGDIISYEGKKEIYRGKTQFIINKIHLLSKENYS
jgi:DNA/RNA endonuclease YhcR with UshA esterase domain